MYRQIIGGVPKLHQLVLFESKFMTHEIGDCKVQDYIVQNPISIRIIIYIRYGLVRLPKNVEAHNKLVTMSPRSKNTIQRLAGHLQSLVQ